MEQNSNCSVCGGVMNTNDTQDGYVCPYCGNIASIKVEPEDEKEIQKKPSESEPKSAPINSSALFHGIIKENKRSVRIVVVALAIALLLYIVLICNADNWDWLIYDIVCAAIRWFVIIAIIIGLLPIVSRLKTIGSKHESAYIESKQSNDPKIITIIIVLAVSFALSFYFD